MLRRTEFIAVRVSRNELDQLDSMRKDSGLNRSDYVRSVLFKTAPKKKNEIVKEKDSDDE